MSLAPLCKRTLQTDTSTARGSIVHSVRDSWWLGFRLEHTIWKADPFSARVPGTAFRCRQASAAGGRGASLLLFPLQSIQAQADPTRPHTLNPKPLNPKLS